MSVTKQKLCRYLPDCMMPDGGDPCGGYLKLYEEIDHLESQIAILREGLRRGCSCRPGGGICPCCETLTRAGVGE